MKQVKQRLCILLGGFVGSATHPSEFFAGANQSLVRNKPCMGTMQISSSTFASWVESRIYASSSEYVYAYGAKAEHVASKRLIFEYT